jgi:hypothetical protein
MNTPGNQPDMAAPRDGHSEIKLAGRLVASDDASMMKKMQTSEYSHAEA